MNKQFFTARGGRGMRHRQRDPEHGVGAETTLVGGSVEGD